MGILVFRFTGEADDELRFVALLPQELVQDEGGVQTSRTHGAEPEGATNDLPEALGCDPDARCGSWEVQMLDELRQRQSPDPAAGSKIRRPHASSEPDLVRHGHPGGCIPDRVVHGSSSIAEAVLDRVQAQPP
jgi:hypothetical protein